MPTGRVVAKYNLAYLSPRVKSIDLIGHNS